jgi:oligopeptide transport system substrate-binding protein
VNIPRLGLLIGAVAVLAGVAATAISFVGSEPDAIVLKRGNVEEPDTLDPHRYGLTYESEIMRDLFVGLLGIDAKGKLIPGAAESWTISEDGRVYTLKMREGHVWSDGTPVTADDAVFSIRRALDGKTNANYANLAYKIKNALQVNKGELKPEDLGVRALDVRTVEITLDRPSPVLLNILSIPLLFPVPKHAIEKYGNDWVKPGNMISNGPFTLAEWLPNDYVRVKKNPLFYDAASVLVDEVYFYPIGNDSTALKRFRAGELDFNGRFVHADANWLKQNMPDAMRMTTASWVSYFVINQQIDKFKDVRVRKAMAMLIDREALCQRVLGLGEVPAYGLVAPVIEGYQGAYFDFRTAGQAEREAEARRLLAEAGYSDAKPLTFTMRIRSGMTNKMVAVAVQEMWSKAGVKAELAVSEVKVHYNDLREKDFEVADAGWVAPLDPEYYIYLVRTESTETNYGSYSNAEYDRIAYEAEGMIDIPKRYASFAAAEKIALDEVAMIPLFFNVNRNLVAAHLKGFENNPQDFHLSRFMSLQPAVN